MANPKYGQLVPADYLGGEVVSQRVEDEREADAYVGSVLSVSSWGRPAIREKIHEAYLAGVAAERARMEIAEDDYDECG